MGLSFSFYQSQDDKSAGHADFRQSLNQNLPNNFGYVIPLTTSGIFFHALRNAAARLSSLL